MSPATADGHFSDRRLSGDSRGETTLHGGTSNRGLVTRRGDTVRRPRRAASPGIHALLQHLEQVGFEGSPRLLGVDERGREVLSYIPGQAITPPYPAWAMTIEALVSVARLVRRYHEAVEGFDASPYTWGSEVPAPYRGDLMSHNDLNLDNVIFREGRAVALIDFDLTSPGSRLWDVAMAARLWIPLRDPRDTDEARRGEVDRRLQAFVSAYGLSRSEREDFVAAARATHGWCYDIVRSEAARRHPGYVDYWNDSQGRDQRARNWMAEHVQGLTELVTAADV